MAALLTAQTTDTLSAAVQLKEGANTILLKGEFDAASVILLLSETTDGEYQPFGTFHSREVKNIDVSEVCFLKAQQVGSRSKTNITVLTL